MRRTKKIRASKDEQVQEDTLPLTQTPGFIIGMTFLGVVAAVLISVLIYRFIHRDFYRKYSKPHRDRMTSDPTPLSQQSRKETLAVQALEQLQKARKPGEWKKFFKQIRNRRYPTPLPEGGDGEG